VTQRCLGSGGRLELLSLAGMNFPTWMADRNLASVKTQVSADNTKSVG
jgi:hypothetical protein